MREVKQNPFLFVANTICQDFVYFKTTSDQILLCHPGTWIDQKFCEKYNTINNKINTSTVVDQELKEKIKRSLLNHLELEFENELSQSKTQLLVLFNNMLEERKSFLNWSIACFEVFNKASADELNELHETDLNLFRKAHLSGSISIWASLSNGLYDPSFLEDIFHITFFQDAGLIGSEYSYFITEALDQESISPGYGIRYLLNQNAKAEEIKLFKEHPFRSLEYIQNMGYLNNPDLVNTVLFGHELSNGEGFPFGYTEEVLSSWEKIIIIADQLVKYNSTTDYDFLKELEVIRSSKLDLLPVRKVLNKSLRTITCFHQEVSA